MALRKQVAKDANKIPSGNQQIGNMQEDDALDDGDNNDELSSSLLSPLLSRDKRRREKENKSKPKEMTEEEMMDLALRLSEQEASITALRQQKEEEAMMKAIQESMDSQTQPCPSSQGLLDDAEASLRICSRRKLVYSNGKPISAIDQRASEENCTPQTDLNRGAKRSGDGDTRGFLGLESNVNKKLRRKEGSPLLEMPDLSQTQKNDSQASPCSSDVPDLPLDSPQSSASTQIEDCQLRKCPVFPLTARRPEVRVPRLTQDLLQSCRTSGFVSCSQDSVTSPQKLLLAQPKSPTFPKSHKLSNKLSLLKSTASPKSPVFSETDQGEDGQTQPSPEYVKSPVFGRNTQHENSPSACKLQVGVCNSGFTFSSQESLASSLRSTTCQPKSPVFPRSPSPPSERSATCKSPVYSETDGGQTEQSNGHCTSPASSGTGQRICLDVQKHSASPSPAELRDSGGQENSDTTAGLSQRTRPDSESDRNQNVLNKSSKSDDGEEELKETSKDQESLTSNMTLFWSEEDDDVTLVGSPSPVFPEERPAHQADGRPSSLDHVTAASPGTKVLSRPSSSSTSTGQQQLSTTQREPISRQETVSRASAPPGSTVHYYWGVPFCPRGLDPDDYTQVILAQMEVYEKSLKQAQRCLLRKAEWGEAVLPQPEKSPSSSSESPQQLFPQRQGLRLRSKKLCDTDDAPPAEADDNKGEEEEEERENKEEGKKNEGEGQVESDDCEICPETQLSDNDHYRTQHLTMDTGRGPELRPKSPELPEVEMILQNNSPAEDEQQKEEEVEVEVDKDQKTKGTDVPVTSSDIRGQYVRKEEDVGGPDVMEMKDRGLQRSISPELELAVVPQNPETSMDCPICQGSFPVTEIEMHAAYCDGEVASRDTRRPKTDSFQASLKPRRKRTRKAEVTAEDPNDTPNPVRYQEKCYICQKLVPLRDYSRHTELCIHRQGSKAGTPQRTQGQQKENLLSALEKTESRNSGAGPSGSKLQPGDVIDLRDDDDDDCEEGGVPAIRISNSPIRSFTPISEATDCLIDFKKQYRTKKMSQRPR